MVMVGVTIRVHPLETSVQDLKATQFTIEADASTVMVTAGPIQNHPHHLDHTGGLTTPPDVTIHGSMTRAILVLQENTVRICIRGQKMTPPRKTSVVTVVMSNGVTVMAMDMVTTIQRGLGTAMPSHSTPHNMRTVTKMDTETIQMATMRTIVQIFGAIQL